MLQAINTIKTLKKKKKSKAQWKKTKWNPLALKLKNTVFEI